MRELDNIKSGERLAGYVVVCLDDGLPVLATHRLFPPTPEGEEDAINHCGRCCADRQPVVFALRHPHLPSE